MNWTFSSSTDEFLLILMLSLCNYYNLQNLVCSVFVGSWKGYSPKTLEEQLYCKLMLLRGFFYNLSFSKIKLKYAFSLHTGCQCAFLGFLFWAPSPYPFFPFSCKLMLCKWIETVILQNWGENISPISWILLDCFSNGGAVSC